MPFTLAIAHTCRIGALYGFSASAPENSIFAQLLFLLDVARLAMESELANGVVSPNQQTQRLSLEFLIHLAGTGMVPIHDDALGDLHYRMHLHMQVLARRLRAVGHRFQSFGGDVAYLRAVWTEDNIYTGDRAHPLFYSEEAVRQDDRELTPQNIANGMSIFHYIEAVMTREKYGVEDVDSFLFLSALWTDIAIAYAPLVGDDVDELVDKCPASMKDLLLQYFELAKRPSVLAALTEVVSGDTKGECE